MAFLGRRTATTALALLPFCLVPDCLLPNCASAAGAGQLSGAVTDARGEPLSSASVRIVDTAWATMTDADGHYLLPRLPAGDYELRVSHVGYRDGTHRLRLGTDSARIIDVVLEDGLYVLDEIVVVGGLTSAQAQALNAQKAAANLKHVVSRELFSRFPDFNAAETIQRLPGVVIDRDQGEGEFVHMRGLSAQLNAVTVNGRRIPSPTADLDEGRAVGMDLIQAHSTGSIEVVKALTPDMAADAMGGTVNLNLRRPPSARLVGVSAGGGYNHREARWQTWGGEIGELSGVAGDRFGGGRLGLLVAGNLQRSGRGALRRELAYVSPDADELEFHRWDNYDIRRDRFGLLLGAEYRHSPQHETRLNLTWNRFVDDEIRRRRQYEPAEANEIQETRNRREDQRFAMLDLAGEGQAGRWRLAYGASVAGSSEELPDRTYFRYERDNPFADTVGEPLSTEALLDLDLASTFAGLGPFALNRLRYDNDRSEERDWSASLDLQYGFGFRDGGSSVQAGISWLRKDRRSWDRRWQHLPSGQIEAGEGSFGFVDVRYDDPTATRLFPLSRYKPVVQELNYEGDETVLAGYAMGTLHWAEDVTTLLGVRAEGTAQSYEHQVSLEASDESYVNMLPSLHVTWRFRDGAQLRLALTSGLARPEYSRLLPVAVPFEGQILKGNPELVASRSYGGDLALEAYPGPLGLFSAGVFAKRILDPVVTRVSRQQLLGQTFETVEPVNGEAGTVSGVELAWVQQLAVLGLRPLRHFGLYSNYTYARSRVDYGDLRRGRHPLPKSPSHAGNVGLLYDNGTSGTALTVSANYRAPMLLRLEAQDRGDVWFEEELHVDLSVRQRLSAGWSLFLKLNNLTNEARRETFGDPRDGEWRRRKTERYGRYGVLGVSYGG